MFGVSPAFIISKYGINFTVEQFCESLVQIKDLGFKGFQPEVFLLSELEKWHNDGAKLVSERATQLKLIPTQFVAHFLLESFSTSDKLFSDSGIEELKIVIDIVDEFPKTNNIVVPIGPFCLGGVETKDQKIYDQLKERLTNKLKIFLDLIRSSGKNFALEIMPNSIVEGINGFLDLHRLLGSPKEFGISLDTGHTWASREIVSLTPLKLKEKIFGLHLCDNDSNLNKSLPPGKGTIDWNLFMKSLVLSGYQGSLDIEVICEEKDIDEEYSYGKETLEKIIQNNKELN